MSTITRAGQLRHDRRPTQGRSAAPAKSMFGFLTPQTKDSSDPLQNAKSAAAWLRQLPALATG